MQINEYISADDKEFVTQLLELKFKPAATRRPRLTLMHLNKLRKVRELWKLQKQKHKQDLPTIYMVPVGDDRGQEED